MAAAWPAVVDYLVTNCSSLWPTVAIFDGAADTGDDPNDYVTIGHAADSAEGSPGSYTQIGNQDGYSLAEVGSVVCELVCQTGDDDAVHPQRTHAFGLLGALEAHVRKDQTLSAALSVNGTATLACQPLVSQGRGTAFSLLFTLNYTSDIYDL